MQSCFTYLQPAWQKHVRRSKTPKSPCDRSMPSRDLTGSNTNKSIDDCPAGRWVCAARRVHGIQASEVVDQKASNSGCMRWTSRTQPIELSSFTTGAAPVELKCQARDLISCHVLISLLGCIIVPLINPSRSMRDAALVYVRLGILFKVPIRKTQARTQEA